MIRGLWTAAQFRVNSKHENPFAGRKGLILDIEIALDEAHAAVDEMQLQYLTFVVRACNAWLEGHPGDSSRKRGVQQLLRQVDEKRKELYKISPEVANRKMMVTSLYEKSDKQLKIAPGNKDPRELKGRAAFHQELLERTIAIRRKEVGFNEIDLNPEQIGFLHAKALLKVSHIKPANRDKAKVEALLIISKMLGKSPELARLFTTSSFEIVVVPAEIPLTSLPEFKVAPSLVDQVTGLPVVISENVGGKSRTWAETRGMGGIQIGQKIYIAITEENLLGTAVTGGALTAGGKCYAAKYSTTAHEFAHTIHLHAMTQGQKQVIVDCYKRKLRGVVVQPDSTVRSGTIALDGSMSASVVGGVPVTPMQAKQALEVEWVDGNRLHNTPWGSEQDIYVKNFQGAFVANGNVWSSFKSRYSPTTNYAASSAREYWAQLASAYMGCNGGTDPYTGRARHNDRAWVATNEEPAMLNLLDEVFSPHGGGLGTGGTSTGFGAVNLPDSNVLEDAGDEPTVFAYIKNKVAMEKLKKAVKNNPTHDLMKQAMLKRRAQFGEDDD